MRRLLWPALITACIVCLTTGLGIWQVQRLAWKEGLLRDIAQSEARPPTPLRESAEPFRQVLADGAFLPGVARYGAEVRPVGSNAEMGSHVLGALRLDGGGVVIVDRGWAPDDFKATQPGGPQEIQGFVHPIEHIRLFGVSDDLKAGRFFSLNPAKVASYLGYKDVLPFTLVELGRQGTLPEPATGLPKPPNNHLSYAVTWFGLALGSIGVFAAYSVQLVRRERSADRFGLPRRSDNAA